jgi:C4-dicarboxylate transporter DctM subunit
LPTWWSSSQDIGLAAEQIGNGLYNSYVLLAVPMFVFAANIMNAGTVSERMFDFCRILVGRMRGGLAQVDILVSVIFSGMSGSAIADAAGPGLVTIRQMLKKPEYSRGFAGAVVVASATLGPIIPPSIPMVIYGLVSGASVGALFLGGVVPGVLMALSDDGGGALHRGQAQHATRGAGAAARMARCCFAARCRCRMPIVLLGGIYSGAFTPTEAAAVAALHSLILATLWSTARWTGAAFGGGAGVGALQRSDHADPGGQLPAQLRLHRRRRAAGHGAVGGQHAARPHRLPAAGEPDAFLVLGCFLDVSVLLLVFVPMLLPAAKAAGHRPGALWRAGGAEHDDRPGHPPFGMLLFVTKALTGIPIGEMLK